MGYAIIQTGGKQFRVSEGEVIRVPSLGGEVGSSVAFDALARGDGNDVSIGTPALDDARVTAIIVEHGRGPKIIVFKKKRRKQYKKKHGHRQDFTAIRIESIGGLSAKPDAETAKTDAAEVETVQASGEVEAAAVETETVAFEAEAAAPEAEAVETETASAESDADETEEADDEAAEEKE